MKLTEIDLKSQSEKLVALTNRNEKLELAQRISRRWGITEDIKLALLKKVFPGKINHSCLADLSDVFHRTIFLNIWSGKCVGISESYQFLYTPLGAMINNPFIFPLS